MSDIKKSIYTLIILVAVSITAGIILFNLPEQVTRLESNPNYTGTTKKTTTKKIKPTTFSTQIDKLEIYYLALKGHKTLDVSFNISDEDKTEIDSVTWTIKDEEILSIEGNKMYGKKVGTTTLTGTLANGYSRDYEVMVTDLIVPATVNHSKKALPCKKYTKEQAELLDKILASRVEEGGEGTRGGVLAAARFITLEFPYVIKYFNENGRLDAKSGRKKVDGEGRYYHKGLYLDESKFDDLLTRDDGSIYKDTGPAIWGCKLYDRYVSKYRANGLTCSGFVSWAMLNGGFDVGDVGAGNHKNIDNELYDLGEHHEITLEYMKGNTYKAGDFIGRNGHAAIIIGFDDTTLYVAEELPRNPGQNNLDLNAYTYGRYDNKKKLKGHNKLGVVVDTNLTYVIEMSDIYPNGDGYYTNMWES